MMSLQQMIALGSSVTDNRRPVAVSERQVEQHVDTPRVFSATEIVRGKTVAPRPTTSDCTLTIRAYDLLQKRGWVVF